MPKEVVWRPGALLSALALPSLEMKRDITKLITIVPHTKGV